MLVNIAEVIEKCFARFIANGDSKDDDRIAFLTMIVENLGSFAVTDSEFTEGKLLRRMSLLRTYVHHSRYQLAYILYRFFQGLDDEDAIEKDFLIEMNNFEFTVETYERALNIECASMSDILSHSTSRKIKWFKEVFEYIENRYLTICKDMDADDLDKLTVSLFVNDDADMFYETVRNFHYINVNKLIVKINKDIIAMLEKSIKNARAPSEKQIAAYILTAYDMAEQFIKRRDLSADVIEKQINDIMMPCIFRGFELAEIMQKALLEPDAIGIERQIDDQFTIFGQEVANMFKSLNLFTTKYEKSANITNSPDIEFRMIDDMHPAEAMVLLYNDFGKRWDLIRRKLQMTDSNYLPSQIFSGDELNEINAVLLQHPGQVVEAFWLQNIQQRRDALLKRPRAGIIALFGGKRGKKSKR